MSICFGGDWLPGHACACVLKTTESRSAYKTVHKEVPAHTGHVPCQTSTCHVTSCLCWFGLCLGSAAKQMGGTVHLCYSRHDSSTATAGSILETGLSRLTVDFSIPVLLRGYVLRVYGLRYPESILVRFLPHIRILP